MELPTNLDPEHFTPARIWKGLDPATRRLAAMALFGHDSGDAGSRQEAVRAIAGALKFREVAVRRLAVERRAEHLARAVQPDESLAASLLVSLHLAERSDLLGRFLDALEVPHEGGSIDSEYEPQSFETGPLEQAVASIDADFPRDHVDLYLASLLALDPELWGGLGEILGRRRS